MAENRYAEAIDTYKRLQISFPEKLDFNLNLAEAYLKLKKTHISRAFY